MTSGSRTIIAEAQDRLRNPHPGEFLREDFLVGGDVPLAEIGAASGIPIGILDEVLAGRRPIDAEIDLRLSRYFGMSEGFFLGLQHDYDLEEARDAHREALKRIVRRAA